MGKHICAILFYEWKEKTMGKVYAEITLKNVYDVVSAKKGFIKEEQVHSAVVTVMVDTGATMDLVISEELCQQLGLGISRMREVRLANNQTEVAKVTDPVEVHWKDRDYIGNAWVLSGLREPLMGLLPLEHMDLMVDPVNQTLIGAHGDEMISYI
jgi:clan AA aspartic protease